MIVSWPRAGRPEAATIRAKQKRAAGTSPISVFFTRQEEPAQWVASSPVCPWLGWSAREARKAEAGPLAVRNGARTAGGALLACLACPDPGESGHQIRLNTAPAVRADPQRNIAASRATRTWVRQVARDAGGRPAPRIAAAGRRARDARANSRPRQAQIAAVVSTRGKAAAHH